jgi:MFS transporter, putative metabolite:H+ symporter
MNRKPGLAEQIESSYARIGVGGAHRQIAAMILLGVFFDALEQNAVGITGPILREVWGLGATEIGLLNTATFGFTALGRIVTGLVMDRWGRRRMLMVNLLIFTVGSLACALAPGYWSLLLGRSIVGFGLGGEIAVAVIMMAEFFSARHRGTAVGLINVTAAGLGNMLAPAFGLLVFATFDGPERWRWVYALLFFPALLVLYFRRFIPETPRYLASTGRIAEANLVLNRLARNRLAGPIDAPEVFLDLADASGAASASASELTAKAASQAGAWRLALRGRLLSRTLLLSVAVCMSYAAQISMLTLMPTILVAQGHQLSSSLWITLAMQSGSLLGAISAAWLASRQPRKKVLSLAAICGCLAGLAMAASGGQLLSVIACGVVFNFSVIVLNTTIWLYAPELYPTPVRGFGTSIILAVGSLSGGLFPLISGAVFDAHGLRGMFSLLAALFVVLAVAVRFPEETFGKPMEEGDTDAA